MAARNNPLINWLNLSFDSFNLLHRWTGRIVVLEIIAHVIAFAVGQGSNGGLAAVVKAVEASTMEQFGFAVSGYCEMTSWYF